MGVEIGCSEVLARVEPLLAKYEGKRGVLVPLLQDIQAEFGYLREDVVKFVAERLGLSPAQIYGVATFYTQFYFEPRGRHVIKVCVGTACHIRGAPAVLKQLENDLGVQEGETSPDGEFTLETVSCLGCCGLAPVVMVNERVVRKRDHKKVFSRLKSRAHAVQT